MNNAIKSAALAISRPLVRFLIGHGWTYGAMAELLKYVCVEESCRRAGLAARVLTDSKVSLISGVHRKEVHRIREELGQSTAQELPLRHGANVAAQLTALWMTHPDYQDERGEPLSVPMRAENAPCLEELARLIKADMRPRTILDDLVRAGVAAERAGMIHLLRTSYLSDVPEDRLAFLGTNVGDHLSAAVHNLEGVQPAFIEQAVYFDHLPAPVLDAIRQDLRRIGEKMIRDAYRRVSKLELDEAITPSNRRMRMGVYYFEEEHLPTMSATDKAAVDQPTEPLNQSIPMDTHD
jgi:hypothetical protein